jgi:hypothetical protein
MGGDFPEVALVSPYSLPGSAVRGRIFSQGAGLAVLNPETLLKWQLSSAEE